LERLYNFNFSYEILFLNKKFEDSEKSTGN
jgi:hypothetical protein